MASTIFIPVILPTGAISDAASHGYYAPALWLIVMLLIVLAWGFAINYRPDNFMKYTISLSVFGVVLIPICHYINVFYPG